MKTKKILIPSLAIVAGAALVGSVSGTVAWYQYSTRVTAAIVGTSVKCSDLLEIKAANLAGTKDTGWKTDIVSSDISGTGDNKLGLGSELFQPVTPNVTASLTGNSDLPAKFKKNPVYKSFDVANWRDAEANVQYLQYKLFIRDRSVEATPEDLDKDLYLTNVTIEEHTEANDYDLSSAIRVHIDAGDKQLLLSAESATKNGEAGQELTAVALSGALDLNGDGVDDPVPNDRYADWDDMDAGVYGNAGKTMTAANSKSLATINDDATLTTTGAYALGKTGDDGEGLEITVTVWLEGWAQLNPAAAAKQSKGSKTYTEITALADPEAGDVYYATDEDKYYRYDGSNWYFVPKAAVWDTNYIGKDFHVGLEFAVAPSDGE